MSNPLRRGPKPPDPAGTAKPKSQAASTPTPPVEPSNRTAEILTISVIVALLVLFGIGLMLWAVEYQEYRVALAPTATPTATSAPAPTRTPDFRATRFSENMLTQTVTQTAATPAAGDGTIQPSVTAVSTMFLNLPMISDEAGRLVSTPVPTGVPAGTTVSLPSISYGGDQTPSPTPTLLAASGTPTPSATTQSHIISLPFVSNYQSPATPTSVPTVEAATSTPTLVVVIATSQLFDTPTVAPPSTSTPIPSPTALPYFVDSLKAFIRAQDTDVRIGPGNIYTVTGTIEAGAEVNLLRRNHTGEWVWACCLEIDEDDVVRNENFWVRQAYAPPVDNELSASAPEGANPNDVRWLLVQPIQSDLQPLPTTTPIPEGDYPLYRYTPDNQARLPDLPNPPLRSGWSEGSAQAAQALSSPAAISGSSVLVASEDNHLYSFDRINGNQRWRRDMGEPIRVAPAVQENEIYVATESGRIFAFDEFGTELWNTDLELPFRPVTSFNIFSDTLFIGAVNAPEATERRIIAIDRQDRDFVRSYPVTGNTVLYPTIGDQMIYLENNGLRAYDVVNAETREEVWSSPIVNLTAPPVYSSVGVTGMAELYVADGANFIHNLDANTGKELWDFENEELATGMALNDFTLFVSGTNYVKALARRTGEELWRTNVQGVVLGSPLVDDSTVVIVTEVGNVQFLHAGTGEVLQGGSVLRAPAAGSAAVSGSWIFVPSVNGSLYALREGP